MQGIFEHRPTEGNFTFTSVRVCPPPNSVIIGHIQWFISFLISIDTCFFRENNKMKSYRYFMSWCEIRTVKLSKLILSLILNFKNNATKGLHGCMHPHYLCKTLGLLKPWRYCSSPSFSFDYREYVASKLKFCWKEVLKIGNETSLSLLYMKIQ